MKKKAKWRVSVPSDTLLACIPTNWCDPMLTGPDAVLPKGYKYTPADIERLLNSIRERLKKAIATNKAMESQDDN